jgi:hypothetical protein
MRHSLELLRQGGLLARVHVLFAEAEQVERGVRADVFVNRCCGGTEHNICSTTLQLGAREILHKTTSTIRRSCKKL